MNKFCNQVKAHMTFEPINRRLKRLCSCLYSLALEPKLNVSSR